MKKFIISITAMIFLAPCVLSAKTFADGSRIPDAQYMWFQKGVLCFLILLLLVAFFFVIRPLYAKYVRRSGNYDSAFEESNIKGMMNELQSKGGGSYTYENGKQKVQVVIYKEKQ